MNERACVPSPPRRYGAPAILILSQYIYLPALARVHVPIHTAGTQQSFREKNAMLMFKFVSYCAHEKIVKKPIKDSAKFPLPYCLYTFFFFDSVFILYGGGPYGGV